MKGERVSTPEETPEQQIAKLQAENDALRAGPGATAEAVPEPAVVKTPLEALKDAEAANPEGTFIDHLKALADDGIRAVIDPTDEADVLRVLASVVSDVVAKVG